MKDEIGLRIRDPDDGLLSWIKAELAAGKALIIRPRRNVNENTGEYRCPVCGSKEGSRHLSFCVEKTGVQIVERPRDRRDFRDSPVRWEKALKEAGAEHISELEEKVAEIEASLEDANLRHDEEFNRVYTDFRNTQQLAVRLYRALSNLQIVAEDAHDADRITPGLCAQVVNAKDELVKAKEQLGLKE